MSDETIKEVLEYQKLMEAMAHLQHRVEEVSIGGLPDVISESVMEHQKKVLVSVERLHNQLGALFSEIVAEAQRLRKSKS